MHGLVVHVYNRDRAQVGRSTIQRSGTFRGDTFFAFPYFCDDRLVQGKGATIPYVWTNEDTHAPEIPVTLVGTVPIELSAMQQLLLKPHPLFFKKSLHSSQLRDIHEAHA